MDLPLCTSINLWVLRIGAGKVLVCAFGGQVYVGWMSRFVSSSVVDITGAKEMCSISVSHNVHASIKF